MGLQLTNNARSTLAAAMTTTDTALRVTVGHGGRFPALADKADWFPIGVANASGAIEYMRATARVGDTITVMRAQEGTGSLAFPAGSAVFLPLTKAAMEDIQANAGALAVSIGDTVIQP